MDYFKEENISVAGGYRSYPFFNTIENGIMQCVYPKWESDSSAYSGLIITQENSRGGELLDKCPLREGECANISTKYTYSIKLG